MFEMLCNPVGITVNCMVGKAGITFFPALYTQPQDVIESNFTNVVRHSHPLASVSLDCKSSSFACSFKTLKIFSRSLLFILSPPPVYLTALSITACFCITTGFLFFVLAQREMQKARSALV